MGKRKSEMKLSSRKNGTLVPEDDSDSDLQEFSLPKKRIIKPGKSTYVARRRCGCCRVCASVFLSVLLMASVLCVIVLGWFSLRLKRDLDFVRNRLSKVESYDRSTTREYGDLSKDMNDKYQRLKASEDEAVKLTHEHYKSLLKQIAHLNFTVTDLQKRLEAPENANTLTRDIESLKKGMADTGGEITEVKDKIKQLTDLAGLEHTKIDDLTNQLFNLSVQVAHVMGKPTPKPLDNTGTPPLILRMPVSSDESTVSEDKASFKNFTTAISTEVARIMGIVTAMNHTLTSKVVKLKDIMKSLLKEVKKHVETIGDLQKKVSQMQKPTNSNVVPRDHHRSDITGVIGHLFNLSIDVTRLSEDVQQHSRQLDQMALDVTKVNRSVHQHEHESASVEKAAACNCLTEIGKLWEQLSSNKLDIESVQQQLKNIEKPSGELHEAIMGQEQNETVRPQNRSGSLEDSEDELEQEDMKSDIKEPSPTSTSHVSSLSVKVEEFSKSPSVNTSLSRVVNSTSASVATSDRTAASEIPVSNSTRSKLSTSIPVEGPDTKLPIESSEETLEESLEKI
ncbi:uncharacterized protein LOC114963105 isoform X2 [Acropora millepora]|uniref:uncharacterized protein LOC114963105 isoform X2 n=1 Tax=Acropora millepora TaxID=45264 RepID=UPI001CF5512E|nr:uncharacterized protein LOC114963105 isoform X2 [Acropora millepora]